MLRCLLAMHKMRLWHLKALPEIYVQYEHSGHGNVFNEVHKEMQVVC